MIYASLEFPDELTNGARYQYLQTQMNLFNFTVGMDFCDRPGITIYYSYFSAN